MCDELDRIFRTGLDKILYRRAAGPALSDVSPGFSERTGWPLPRLLGPSAV